MNIRSILFCVLLSFVILMFTPQIAFAHGIGGVAPSSTTSIITSVEPTSKDFSIESIENGLQLKIKRITNTVVTVLGVDGEQYIQLRASGVYLNEKSSTRVINLSMSVQNQNYDSKKEFAKTSSDPDTKPVWKKVSKSNIYTWHDHRGHYMGSVPLGIKNLGESTIPVVAGNTTHEVTIQFIAHPSSLRYLSISILAILLVCIVMFSYFFPSAMSYMEKKVFLFFMLCAAFVLESFHLISYMKFTQQALGTELLSIMYGIFFLICALICISILIFSKEKDGENFFISHAPIIALTGFLGLAVGSLLEYKSLIEPYPASTNSAFVTQLLVVSIGVITLFIGLLGLRHIKQSQHSPALKDEV